MAGDPKKQLAQLDMLLGGEKVRISFSTTDRLSIGDLRKRFLSEHHRELMDISGHGLMVEDVFVSAAREKGWRNVETGLCAGVGHALLWLRAAKRCRPLRWRT